MTDESTCWFAGVDWGSEQHQVCILDAAGKVRGERAFPHGGAGLVALCDWLVSVAGSPGSVAVAIEVPHGPVVDALQDRGFAVHAINPKQLDRLRDRFSVAGAKDDRRDAWIAAVGLRTDLQLFRPVQIGDPMVIELREWSRLAAELQQERVRLGNRVRQQLWRYYPQLLELTDDVAAEWVLELWLMAPTQRKRRAYARQHWLVCTSSIASARSALKPQLVYCVRRHSRFPQASRKRPSCICVPLSTGSAWRTGSSARAGAHSMISAL